MVWRYFSRKRFNDIDLVEPEFIKSYKEKQPEAFERRSKTYFARSNPNVRGIEIAPKRVCRYRGRSSCNIPVAYFDILDIDNGKAYSIESMDYFYARTPVYGECACFVINMLNKLEHKDYLG